MRSLYIIVVCVFFASSAFATFSADTIIQIHGKVIDKNQNSPLKVKVEYKSVPYATLSGNISSNENGEFDVYVKSGSKYTLKVVAEGYFPFAEELDFTIASETLINKEISMEGGDVGYVIRLENLIFAQGSAVIAEDSYAELDDLAERLQRYPKMVIQLEGHTDFRGSEDANMKLSQERVRNVREYLLKKGIEGNRVQMRAFGGTQPLSRENSPEAARLNRRVEVRIISVE